MQNIFILKRMVEYFTKFVTNTKYSYKISKGFIQPQANKRTI